MWAQVKETVHHCCVIFLTFNFGFRWAFALHLIWTYSFWTRIKFANSKQKRIEKFVKGKVSRERDMASSKQFQCDEFIGGKRTELNLYIWQRKKILRKFNISIYALYWCLDTVAVVHELCQSNFSWVGSIWLRHKGTMCSHPAWTNERWKLENLLKDDEIRSRNRQRTQKCFASRKHWNANTVGCRQQNRKVRFE